MEINTQLLESYWQAFNQDGTINPDVRPFIAEAWIRCRQRGLDMNEGIGTKLNEYHFAASLQNNHLLTDIAAIIMVQLYETLQNSDSIIFICDRSGCILDAYYDRTLEIPLREAKLIPGYRWSEAENGLTSMDLTVRLDQPVQVIGPEHYCKNHHNAVGSSAPIHDKNQNIIASINLVSFLHQYTKHSLSVVTAGAALIENQLDLKTSLNLFEKVFHSMAEGMILINQNLKIEKINDNAKRILSLTAEEEKTFDPLKVLKEVTLDKSAAGKSSQLNFHFKNRVIQCYGELDCVQVDLDNCYFSIIFKEIKTINKMINRMTGNMAFYTFDDIITANETMKSLIRYAKKTANIDSSVLITGPSGTGKELFAQSIHNYSNRSKGPFIAINCAALPADLVESEIFGYEAGAFTGAKKDGKPGKFELADGGTLFLDEIGELPLTIQSKLLRVLDSHRITHLGGKTEKEFNVKIIVATNRDLEKEVTNKNFRLDLFYRINLITLKLPSLAERKEDIVPLATHFLNKLNTENDKFVDSMNQDFINYLHLHPWEGNIRQLQNVISRAYFISEGSLLTLSDLPEQLLQSDQTTDRTENQLGPRGLLEKELIIDTLKTNRGNVTESAKTLRIAKSTLYRKMKNYGISLKRVFQSDD
ncbi:MAG: sigma-54 dependent transcriptional regulator, acetoin dehydrogenase operon transcriptional [Acetobacterium sp.]|jgi:transcriptional regulator with PAS, ATPase and Fis domain|nr:sigma-54 dependent transcriptional regulator, acetoin dehydrogenase operon transcriptional [Acetobacterium sp.]